MFGGAEKTVGTFERGALQRFKFQQEVRGFPYGLGVFFAREIGKCRISPTNIISSRSVTGTATDKHVSIPGNIEAWTKNYHPRVAHLLHESSIY